MPSFLIGSSSFLQVTRTTIKAWMRLNFGGISPLTGELAALESLKKTYKLASTLAPSFLFGSSSFLQVTRETIYSQMSWKFDQFQAWNVELAALDQLKKSFSLKLFKIFDDVLALR